MAVSTSARSAVAAVLLAALAVGPAAPAGAAPASPGQAAPGDLAVTVVPDTGLADGQQVAVTVSGPAEALYVTQCDAAVGEGPTLDELMANCGNQVEVPAGERPATVTYAVASSFTTLGGGRLVGCGVDPGDCLVTVSRIGGQGTVGAPVDVAPPPVVARPDRDLAESEYIRVHVTGTPGTQVRAAVCGEPLGATLAESHCVAELPEVVGEDGRVTATVLVRDQIVVPGSESIRCMATNCSVAAFVWPTEAGAPETLVGEWPIALAPRPPVAWIEPHGAGRDGDFVRVLAEDVQPGVTYALVACDDVVTPWPRCEPPAGAPQVTADGNGRARGEALLSQRFTDAFGSHRYCRNECGFGLLPAGAPLPTVVAGYTLSAGAVDVVPRSRLADGEVVTFSGTGLQPTYAGPPLGPFPTGQWVVGQCASAVLDDVTIVGVFTHCGAPAGVGPVTVRGSTFTVDVPVARTLTRILGGTTDCRASLSACVLVLTRIEQDGSVSLRSTRIAFA